MRKQKTQTYEYVLDNKEKELVLDCLRYCRHRYYQHENSGAQKAIGMSRVEELVNLIEELQ